MGNLEAVNMPYGRTQKRYYHSEGLGYQNALNEIKHPFVHVRLSVRRLYLSVRLSV